MIKFNWRSRERMRATRMATKPFVITFIVLVIFCCYCITVVVPATIDLQGTEFNGGRPYDADYFRHQQQQQQQQQYRDDAYPYHHHHQQQQQPDRFFASDRRRNSHSENYFGSDPRQAPVDASDTESLWTQLLRHLPNEKLQKLHETTCFLRTLSMLEKEGFLLMNPEATKWRKKQALKELQYVLSHYDAHTPGHVQTVVTEEMLNQLILSDFFFQFKGLSPMASMSFSGTTTTDIGAATSPTPTVDASGLPLKQAVEFEAAVRNRRNTSEDHFIVMVKFPDGALVTFVNTKWQEGLLAMVIFTSILIRIVIVPKLALGDLDTKRVRNTILWSCIIFTLALKFILYQNRERGVGELFAVWNCLGLIEVYSISTVPSPMTKNREDWKAWVRDCINHVLHFFTITWAMIAVTYHSYLMGSLATYVLTCTLLSHDLGIIDSHAVRKLQNMINLKNTIFNIIYPNKSIMVNEGKDDVLPNVLQTSVTLLATFLVSVLIRKGGIPYFMIFERPLIFHCSVIYYATASIISSKWYMNRKATVAPSGPLVDERQKEHPATIKQETSTTSPAYSTTSHRQSKEKRRENRLLSHVIMDNPKELGQMAASAASSYATVPPLPDARSEKEWSDIYIKTNLVAVGSSTLFLAIGYLFNISFLFTITGYFFIVMLHWKYLEIFWKKETVVWTMLGLAALLYGSSMMIRSLPSLYNPVEKVIEYSWILLNASAVTRI